MTRFDLSLIGSLCWDINICVAILYRSAPSKVCSWTKSGPPMLKIWLTTRYVEIFKIIEYILKYFVKEQILSTVQIKFEVNHDLIHLSDKVHNLSHSNNLCILFIYITPFFSNVITVPQEFFFFSLASVYVFSKPWW